MNMGRPKEDSAKTGGDKMKHQKLIAMTEAAVMATLSLILNFVIVFRMPQGGTVTLGAMVPIIIVALRRGMGYGMLAGGLSGLLQFITSGQAFHPVSILLDYLLAYGILGIAGLFRGGLGKVALGVVAAVASRFLCHLLSGATIFAAYAGGLNPWIYSLGYNVSYMLPELAVTEVVILLLYRYAERLFFRNERG